MVAEMLTVGPQAMKGSYTPLVKKILDDCRTADSPKLQIQSRNISNATSLSELVKQLAMVQHKELLPSCTTQIGNCLTLLKDADLY